MPWSDPNNWHIAFDQFLGLLGFPFMVNGEDGQPKMNKARTVEGIIIAVMGALFSAISVSAVSFMFVIPEMKTDNLLLKQTVETHASSLHSHEMEAIRHRAEDRALMQSSLNNIQRDMEDLKDKLEKHDADLYIPRTGR